MEKTSTKKIMFPNLSSNDTEIIVSPLSGVSRGYNANYSTSLTTHSISGRITPIEYLSCIEKVAKWFLNQASMSNKKLQKMCYYAYSWFIVFNNDLEAVDSEPDIVTLCPSHFEAWIHGPVCPSLYRKYKEYGWYDIPKVNESVKMSDDLNSLLQQVWEAYGSYTADELEALSHSEEPWIKARKGLSSGQACSRDISNLDILKYYTNLE